jgi:hypothetical protein
MKEKRNVDVKGGYVGMGTQNVDTAEPLESITYEYKKPSHGHPEWCNGTDHEWRSSGSSVYCTRCGFKM